MYFFFFFETKMKSNKIYQMVFVELDVGKFQNQYHLIFVNDQFLIIKEFYTVLCFERNGRFLWKKKKNNQAKLFLYYQWIVLFYKQSLWVLSFEWIRRGVTQRHGVKQRVLAFSGEKGGESDKRRAQRLCGDVERYEKVVRVDIVRKHRSCAVHHKRHLWEGSVCHINHVTNKKHARCSDVIMFLINDKNITKK